MRSLLDTYVYLRRCGERLNMRYVQEEADKLRISDFETANRSLAQHLFEGKELTAADQEMLGYILTSGTYGTVEHRVSNKVRKFGGGFRGRAKYLLSRIFLPMESIKGAYPFFYKHKILLPVFFFYRIGKGLFLRRRMVMTELKSLASRSE